MSGSDYSNSMCEIPFATSELLWSWDVAKDILGLSLGARRALGFPEGDERLSMGEFLAHVSPSSILSLNEARESVLNGSAGSRLEFAYTFDNLQVHEFMLVLSRDENGRALRAMGHYAVSRTEQELEAEQSLNAMPDMGMWLFSVKDRTISRDVNCNILLGLPPKFTLTPLDGGICNMHPEDTARVNQSYELLAQQPGSNTHLEHIVRVCLPNGAYVSMLVWGSVLGYNADGTAAALGGIISRSDEGSRRNDLSFHESRRLLFAVNSTGDGLWDWDATNNSVYFSPRYLSMIGYTADEFPATLETWKVKIHPDDHDKIVYPQQDLVASPKFGDTFECTYRLMRKDGTYAWILGRGYVTHRNADGVATRIVGMHTDITTVQTEREKLEELVKNDVLTGLRSRTYCTLEMERIERNKVRPICVFSVDITGLKLVNDTLGHAAGDKLLSTAAILLRSHLRAMDCVARMGGDEFVILLPGCSPAKGAQLFERTQESFAEHNRNTKDVPILAAFGMAATESTCESLAQLVRQADASMLQCKRAHRNAAQKRIKNWIELNHGITVDLQDCRLAG